MAAGGSALDPEVVGRMLGRRRASGPLDRLSPREREVIALMAEGKSNQGIAEALVVTDAAVEKHVTAIFQKLEPRPDAHRAPPRPGRARVPAGLIAPLQESARRPIMHMCRWPSPPPKS